MSEVIDLAAYRKKVFKENESGDCFCELGRVRNAAEYVVEAGFSKTLDDVIDDLSRALEFATGQSPLRDENRRRIHDMIMSD